VPAAAGHAAARGRHRDGRAELSELPDAAHGELRQAMLDHYLPLQGPAFETWLDQADAVAARIAADKMFTFAAMG
jgi:hypothetical protein